VVDCVRRARASGHALYPVSTGLNWGYGSAAPPAPGAVLLDLSGMRRILNESLITESNPVAVIEPGVTQAQLHDWIQSRGLRLKFNVTGSARDTSILGNALDRGVGYLGPRREDVFGLEVVTGEGDIIQTGFRRLGETSPLAHTHPYGIGPMLDGLFFQGNFGVVTSACFRLLPQAEREVAVSLSLRRPENIPEFIDALAQLKRAGVLGSVTHIGNRARTHASLMAGIADYLQTACGLEGQALDAASQRALDSVSPCEWTSLAGVSGSRAQVSAALAIIKSTLSPLARVQVVDDFKLALGYKVLHPLRAWPWARANAAAIHAVRPLHGLASGVPTDAAITNLLWKFGSQSLAATQLDESRCGLVFINPALPMDGKIVAQVVADMQACASGFGHELFMTLNIETPSSLVAVVNLLFDRGEPAAVERAHACAKALWQVLRRRGLEVYRARADMMADLVDSTDPYWQTVWRLKQAFDPDNIIAPGRYNLAAAPL
jgi:4-cresol dehydrogenase (hydroxylating)